MIEEPSQKLYYGRFTNKICLKEEHGKHVEFEQGIQEIKTFLEETKTDHRCNSSTLNYSASLFLNDQQAVDFVYENYRNLISKTCKPLNELHLWEITNNIRVRVRGLFFGKYRFSCKMSRFKARQTNTNLGELNYETIEPNWQWTSKPVMGNPFEQGQGEVLDTLSRYDRTKWKYTHDYDPIVYCSDATIMTRLRLTYDTVIYDMIMVKTPQELLN